MRETREVLPVKTITLLSPLLFYINLMFLDVSAKVTRGISFPTLFVSN